MKGLSRQTKRLKIQSSKRKNKRNTKRKRGGQENTDIDTVFRDKIDSFCRKVNQQHTIYSRKYKNQITYTNRVFYITVNIGGKNLKFPAIVNNYSTACIKTNTETISNQYYPQGIQANYKSVASNNIIMENGNELESPEGPGRGKDSDDQGGPPIATTKYISFYLATPETAENYLNPLKKTKNGVPENPKNIDSKNERYVEEYIEGYDERERLEDVQEHFNNSELTRALEWEKNANIFDNDKQKEFFNLFLDSNVETALSNYKNFYKFFYALGYKEIVKHEKGLVPFDKLNFAKIEIKHPSKYSSIWPFAKRKKMADEFWRNVEFGVPTPSCGYYDFQIYSSNPYYKN
jgi:hypothetical protein